MLERLSPQLLSGHSITAAQGLGQQARYVFGYLLGVVVIFTCTWKKLAHGRGLEMEQD